MRTIITKTRQAIEDTREMLKDKEEENYKQQTKFYENFVHKDFKQLEKELFPVEDLHIGELNPQIGRRIHNQKLNRLRYMQEEQQTTMLGGKGGSLSQSQNYSKQKLNPWAISRMGHRRCIGEPSYLKECSQSQLAQQKKSFGQFLQQMPYN